MKKNLLIVGIGGHGRVVADTAIRSNKWQKVAFIDDKYPSTKLCNQLPVIGSINDLIGLKKEWPFLIVGIGDNRSRIVMQKQLKKLDFKIATIIHPTATIADDVTISEGSVLFGNSIVNTGSKIGKGVIINTSVSIDHDASIGDGVHISPGVALAGNVTIGSNSWIGIGVAIINNINIGKDVIVGAGAAVIKDVGNSLTVVGVPAEPVK